MMKFGISREHWSWFETEIVAPLKAHGAKVFLFGSRARGTHKKFSDLDILIESQDDLSLLIGFLSEKLEESNFPFKVDLVDARELANSYKKSVERDKVLL
ncbi:MAG: nucleotidyltransferase family protein [Oligoflexus sp.]